jgi:hypothetical protein
MFESELNNHFWKYRCKESERISGKGLWPKEGPLAGVAQALLR